MSDALSPTKAHVGDPYAARFAPATYAPIHGAERCTYCGSITPTRALELMRTSGTHYSGSDWKYGWPHKFYLGTDKFYTAHMIDATPDQVRDWNAYVEPLLGVFIEIRDGAVHWRAPQSAAVRYGDVP